MPIGSTLVSSLKQRNQLVLVGTIPSEYTVHVINLYQENLVQTAHETFMDNELVFILRY